MSTDLVPHTPLTPALPEIGPEERALLIGDLSKLDAEQRAKLVTSVCASLGLNPLTRPFEYLTFQGKLTLYARKDCTDQLRKLYNISVKLGEPNIINDVLYVSAHASTPNGRVDEDFGAVPIARLAGEALANAQMKAVTKAKRRVTLSVCGLGMLDESEIESIPGVIVDGVNQTTGEMIDAPTYSARANPERPALTGRAQSQYAPPTQHESPPDTLAEMQDAVRNAARKDGYDVPAMMNAAAWSALAAHYAVAKRDKDTTPEVWLAGLLAAIEAKQAPPEFDPFGQPETTQDFSQGAGDAVSPAPASLLPLDDDEKALLERIEHAPTVAALTPLKGEITAAAVCNAWPPLTGEQLHSVLSMVTDMLTTPDTASGLSDLAQIYATEGEWTQAQASTARRVAQRVQRQGAAV